MKVKLQLKNVVSALDEGDFVHLKIQFYLMFFLYYYYITLIILFLQLQKWIDSVSHTFS